MKIAVQFIDFTAATFDTHGETVVLREREGHTDIISADGLRILGTMYDTANAEVLA